MRKQLLASAVVMALAAGMTTSAMAFDSDGAGGFHRHSRDLHAGHSGFRRTHAGIRSGGYGHGWSSRRFVGGHNGWGYGPTYYEGVAPFGRLVGPVTGGSTFSVVW